MTNKKKEDKFFVSDKDRMAVKYKCPECGHKKYVIHTEKKEQELQGECVNILDVWFLCPECEHSIYIGFDVYYE